MRKVIIPILLLGIIVAGCAQNQQQPTTPTETTETTMPTQTTTEALSEKKELEVKLGFDKVPPPKLGYFSAAYLC